MKRKKHVDKPFKSIYNINTIPAEPLLCMLTPVGLS